MRARNFVYAIVAAEFLVSVAAVPSEANKRRPTISSAKQCTLDATAGEATVWCEGLICSCCYFDGCYICNKDGADCVWDPGKSGGLKVVPKTKVQPQISPDGVLQEPGGLQEQPTLRQVQ